jgi:hypothetical protein
MRRKAAGPPGGPFIPAAQPLAAAQASQAISRRVTKLVKAAHFHAAYGVHAGTGMVVKPVAFGIWVGLSPKETRSRGVGLRDAMGQAARKWHHRRCI